MRGIIRTRVGYAGGSTADPTYHNIGDHSETIQIDYDPSVISYGELLEIFWSAHNPRTPSSSRQYRSAIFYHDERQQRAATAVRNERSKDGRIYTDIIPFFDFYLAEDYHQKYYLRNDALLMGELNQLYATEESFVNATTPARLNGYLGGFGTPEQLESELPAFGLSPQAQSYLRDRVSR
jgi:methionine-S-sulfoxide reductase